MWFAGVFFLIVTAHATLYDAFTGKPLTKYQLLRYEKENNTEFCVTSVRPCDPNAYRSIDGSCNNLKNPPRGAIHTPSYRVLQPVYGKGYTNRKTKQNQEMKNARYVRQLALLTGKASSTKFTQLSLYFLLFVVNDISSLDDIMNYLNDRPYCCKPKGKTDDMCTPNLIRSDDPVHRFSHVRCMNMTRPLTFQYHKCLPNDTTPQRIMPSTPLFDLSNIYNFVSNAISKLREYSGGRLRADIVDGIEFPPGSDKDPVKRIPCSANEKPKETRCHAYNSNGVVGPTLFTIWVYRLHNSFASELKKINPCWDDEKLFQTVRDILIAYILQIFYYELLPLLLGRKNMIRDGLISNNEGFRDIYDEKIIPQMSDEFEYMMRWFHIAQENSIQGVNIRYPAVRRNYKPNLYVTCVKKHVEPTPLRVGQGQVEEDTYDKEGHYLKTFPMVNLTTRTAFLSQNDVEGQILRGSYRQLTGAFFDHAVDHDLADTGLGTVNLAFDIPMTDLAKGRLFGFAPFKQYREFCAKKSYTKWEDYCDTIDTERLYRLQIIYKDMEDVEVMTGAWSEKQVKGGQVPSTLYCLMVDQLLRNIKADRHWYERKNRPHAFNYEQLLQIRSANIAYLLCLVANKVDKIQPRPFEKLGPKNPFVSCNKLKKIDLRPWKEC